MEGELSIMGHFGEYVESNMSGAGFVRQPQGTEEKPDDQRYCHGYDSHLHRDPAAVDEAREDVPAKVAGPQPVFGRWGARRSEYQASCND